MALDAAGNIYIADAGNSRVLEFARAGNPPAASDAIANRSYGQSGVSDFSDTQCADGVGQDAPPSNHAMCNPGGVAIDAAGNLFVADTANNRVIAIDAPLLGTQNATLVLGQADFTDSGCNGGAQAPGAATLCAPAGLMLDRFGNLWVADANNDRVIKYAAPLGSGAAAAMVIGQGDDGNFTTAGCDRGIAPDDLFGLGADSLCAPAAVAVDANVDLYVADTGNNRSTIYDGIVATPTATADCQRNRHRHGVCHCDRHGERDFDIVADRDRVVFGDCYRERYAVRLADRDTGAARRQVEAECEDDQVRQGRGRQPFGCAHAANRKRGHHDAWPPPCRRRARRFR